MNVREIKRYAFVLTITSLIIGFSACDELAELLSNSQMESMSVKAPQFEALTGEIFIGLVLPLTGPLALTDLSMRYASELALEEINSAQHGDAGIKFLLEDDRSTVEGGIEAYNKLISQNGVPAILGPTTSSATKEVFPIAQGHKIVAISQTSAAQGLSTIGDFVFRASLTVDKLVPNGVQITQQKLGYQRVATIADAVDLFSQSSQTVLTDSLKANDVEILVAETFETGERDFTDQLTCIKESDPDAIFISALSPETTAILIQGRWLGIPAAVPFIATVTLTSEQIGFAGDAAEGAISFTSWVSAANTPGNQAFVQSYSDKYGMQPNLFAAQAYASIYILVEAIANAQSTDSTAIRYVLANVKNYDTSGRQILF
jgi:branched-chain amino acid transport system substrate-binding protein